MYQENMYLDLLLDDGVNTSFKSIYAVVNTTIILRRISLDPDNNNMTIGVDDRAE